MKTYWIQLREWFLALLPRERMIVLAGAAVVAVMVLFLGIWKPLVKAHSGREQSLADSRALAQRLEAVAVDAQRAHAAGTGAINRGGSLISVVDQASKSGTLGKAPSRLQPEGDNEVRLWLDAISFDALVRWLAELETRYGVQVLSADIEKQGTPGVVNARLSLVRP